MEKLYERSHLLELELYSLLPPSNSTNASLVKFVQVIENQNVNSHGTYVKVLPEEPGFIFRCKSSDGYLKSMNELHDNVSDTRTGRISWSDLRSIATNASTLRS